MSHLKSCIVLALSSSLLIAPALTQHEFTPKTHDDYSIFYVTEEQINAAWLDLGRNFVNESVIHKLPMPFIQMIVIHLQHSYGAARVGLIKLIEVMDENKDYHLDFKEITDSYLPAFGHPEDAIAMTFDLYDTNADNYITRYEMAQYQLVCESSEKTVYEIWKDVAGEFYEKDIDGDDRLDVNEFIMYDLYDIGKTIAAMIDAKGLI